MPTRAWPRGCCSCPGPGTWATSWQWPRPPTRATLEAFHARVLSELGLQGLAHGNLTADAAQQLARDVEAALQTTGPTRACRARTADGRAAAVSVSDAVATAAAAAAEPATATAHRRRPPRPARLVPSRCPAERVVQLAPGANVRVAWAHPSAAEANSALLLLFVAGQLGARDHAALSLLAQVRRPQKEAASPGLVVCNPTSGALV